MLPNNGKKKREVGDVRSGLKPSSLFQRGLKPLQLHRQEKVLGEELQGQPLLQMHP